MSRSIFETSITATDTFASERRATPQDSLTMDVLAAEKAGMPYGAWKALHPHTKDENEERLARKKKHTSQRVMEKKCEYCGKTFTTAKKIQRYCDDFCRYQKGIEEKQKRRKQKNV